ncbi:hypothetical protein POM88_021214 [Heracleum sosnowskyi]|uniref:Uncharacterized protein n=1 Tax=Heracleum sosnowskyi TaxID=360622 RepID=A0AAD8MSN8_9APIA|nr:hypothetical protein POM88_021214 [Heracleum sosnowskyi]
MASIKLVGFLLSLVLVFHALRDSSAHVDLGRKLKGDMVMASKEKYTPKMGTTARDASGVVEKGDEARNIVNNKEDNNKVESSSNKKSGAAHNARKCSSDHEGKDQYSCNMLIHKSTRIIVRRLKVAASSLVFSADYSHKYASEESLGEHQHHVNNQDQLSKQELEAAEREVMNLMRRDYRNKPRRKPPINNNKPNN